MADIVTNTLQIGNDKLILRDADAQEKVTGLKEEISDIHYGDVEITNGAIINNNYITAYPGYEGDSIDNDPTSCVSDYVKVIPNTKVKVDKVHITENRAIACYTARKSFLSILAYNSNATSVTVTIPPNAFYLRATGNVGVSPEFSYVSIVSKDFLALEAEHDELQADFDASLDREIRVGNVTEGRYVSAASGYEGTEVGDASSALAYNIQVIPNTKVKFENVFIRDKRSICGYASDKTTFAAVLATNSSETSTILYIPSNVHYLKVTCKTGEAPTLSYIEKGLYIRNWEDYPLADGYIKDDGTSIESTTSYHHSDYIPVVGYMYITASYVATALRNLIFVYDKDKKLIDHPHYSENGAEITNYTYHLPIEAKYIRLNSYRTSVKLTYGQGLQRNQFDVNLSNMVQNRLNGYIPNLFKSAWNKPVITLIDDDTWTYDAVVNFKTFCDDIGIKGNYAVQPCRFELDNRIAPKLLEYERDGFGMVFHCWEQGQWYADYDYELIEDDIVHGLEAMNRAGFINYKYWATPGGIQNDRLVQLTMKWGLKCLITSGWQGDGVETLNNLYPFRRYRLSRNEFKPSLLDTLKQNASDNVGNNSWIILEMHMAHGSDQTAEFKTAMQDFYSYTTAMGYEWRTFPEEMERRMAVYKAFEMF